MPKSTTSMEAAVRIGFECTVLTRPHAGIAFYTYHLLHALAQQVGVEEYTLFYNRPLQKCELPSRMRHALNGPRSTHLWAQLRLASLCRRHGIDLLHSPGQAIPFNFRGPCVLTIHDLSPLLFREQKDVRGRVVWRHLVPRMARKASHIITVSHNTKKDVIELLNIPEERITPIHEAAGPEYYPITDSAEIERFRREKNLQNGYLLAVGTLEPRKNYPFLFKAFKHWLERSGVQATLVVVGKKGWLYDDIFKTQAELGLQDKVRFIGYVADMHELRLYYAAAECFILTPLYEGFWLPGLEALACGTPVIAPNHSSITEVIADAGILVDSWELDAWAEALDRLWRASGREHWSLKGLAHAKNFSWDQAARETLQVYRRLV